MKQALEMALEALQHFRDTGTRPSDLAMSEDAITAIKEALAQPEQEPVAEYVGFTDYAQTEDDAHGFGKVKRLKFIPLNARLYTTLPQRKPLTDEQMPVGWVFYTSDFSMRAAGKSVKGSVLLVRDEAGRKWWLGLEGNRDSDDFPPLYVGAEGETFEQAIANATDKARAIEAAHGIKE